MICDVSAAAHLETSMSEESASSSTSILI